MSREEVVTRDNGSVTVLRRSMRAIRPPKTLVSEQSAQYASPKVQRRKVKKKKGKSEENERSENENESSGSESEGETKKAKKKEKKGKNKKTKEKKRKASESEEKPAKKKKKKEDETHFVFDPEYVKSLVENYPSSNQYWIHSGQTQKFNKINEDHPLKDIKSLSQPGTVYALSFSPSNRILATCSNLGSIRLWDTENWTLISEMFDLEEKEIDEFYVLVWSNDGKHVIVGGKHKSRTKWSQDDEDNAILPTALKIFNVLTGEVVARLEGHTEEIFCLKKVVFQDENYLLTCGEDGRFIRWKMNEDYSEMVKRDFVNDMTTNVGTSFSFVPNTGNKYFIAACDDGLKLFDFEALKLVSSWTGLYSSICDCVKFLNHHECPADSPNNFYLVSKGAELVNEKDQVIHPNKLIMHKLSMPTEKKGKWELEEVHRFTHDKYISNLWYLKFAVNDRYLVAPTTTGQTFIWSLKSKELTAVLLLPLGEIRDILFHPAKPLLLIAGDSPTGESNVHIYGPHEKKDVPPSVPNKNVPLQNGEKKVSVNGSKSKKKEKKEKK